MTPVSRVVSDTVELQGTTSFADLVHVVCELKQLSGEPESDAARVYRNLVFLKARFEDLTTTAQVLLDRLERGTGLPAADMRRLIDYGERFVGELIIAADRIGETVRDLEQAEIERILQAAAEHTVLDGLEATPDSIAIVCSEWRRHWDLFCKWFISEPGRISPAEMLRERIRA